MYVSDTIVKPAPVLYEYDGLSMTAGQWVLHLDLWWDEAFLVFQECNYDFQKALELLIAEIDNSEIDETSLAELMETLEGRPADNLESP